MNANERKHSGPELVKRILLYGVLILLAGTAQCGFFSTLSFLPATPDLVLGCLLGIALLDSGRVAMVASLPAGFFMDAIGGSGIALLPLVYFLTVALMSRLAAKLLPRFLPYAVLLIPGAALRACFTLLQWVLANGVLPKTRQVWWGLLWEVLCTVIVCLPLYPLIRLARIPLVKKSKFNF